MRWSPLMGMFHNCMFGSICPRSSQPSQWAKETSKASHLLLFCKIKAFPGEEGTRQQLHRTMENTFCLAGRKGVLKPIFFIFSSSFPEFVGAYTGLVIFAPSLSLFVLAKIPKITKYTKRRLNLVLKGAWDRLSLSSIVVCHATQRVHMTPN